MDYKIVKPVVVSKIVYFVTIIKTGNASRVQGSPGHAKQMSS